MCNRRSTDSSIKFSNFVGNGLTYWKHSVYAFAVLVVYFLCIQQIQWPVTFSCIHIHLPPSFIYIQQSHLPVFFPLHSHSLAIHFAIFSFRYWHRFASVRSLNSADSFRSFSLYSYSFASLFLHSADSFARWFFLYFIHLPVFFLYIQETHFKFSFRHWHRFASPFLNILAVDSVARCSLLYLNSFAGLFFL